jgi:CubicO group peptidase (beta-lactamase class C family)
MQYTPGAGAVSGRRNFGCGPFPGREHRGRVLYFRHSNRRIDPVKRTLIPLLLLAALAAPALARQTAPPPGFDEYVARVLDAFEVPGVGIAIVSDGEVILARGYGVRDITTGEPVDGHTLFGIASNTKAFTATAMALLVEEGRVRWEDRVIDHLPWFRMWDPFVTRELTIRDLFVHRSGLGLGAGDLLWWPPSDLDRRTISERLRYVKPATSFRSAYAYDNVLYTVAGEVIEEVSGLSWEDFVQRRILDVVGMADSNVLHSAAGEGANAARPHAVIEAELRRVTAFTSDNTNPAGGINSSAIDMARWMIVQMDSGRVAPGGRLFSPRTTRELWGLVTPMPIGTPPPELAPLGSNFNGYALGFNVRDYRGHFHVTHTGGLPGFVSRVAMLPELELGVAVLTNQESGAAFNALAYGVLDHYLGVADHDWVDAYLAVTGRFAGDGSDPFAWPDRPADARPPRGHEAYTGAYRDAWYGHVYVEPGPEGLRIRFEHTPSLAGDLVPWDGDTFIARWDDRELRADVYAVFGVGPEGRARDIRMEWVSRATDFSYDFHDLDLRRVEE